MRSELLQKLLETHCDDQTGTYKEVMMTGPHDFVLMELRQEERKENPNMRNISAESMNMDATIFILATKWLQDRGYITGAQIEYREGAEMPVGVDLAKVQVTPEGVNYEKRLG